MAIRLQDLPASEVALNSFPVASTSFKPTPNAAGEPHPVTDDTATRAFTDHFRGSVQALADATPLAAIQADGMQPDATQTDAAAAKASAQVGEQPSLHAAGGLNQVTSAAVRHARAGGVIAPLRANLNEAGDRVARQAVQSANSEGQATRAAGSAATPAASSKRETKVTQETSVHLGIDALVSPSEVSRIGVSRIEVSGIEVSGIEVSGIGVPGIEVPGIAPPLTSHGHTAIGYAAKLPPLSGDWQSGLNPLPVGSSAIVHSARIRSAEVHSDGVQRTDPAGLNPVPGPGSAASAARLVTASYAAPYAAASAATSPASSPGSVDGRLPGTQRHGTQRMVDPAIPGALKENQFENGAQRADLLTSAFGVSSSRPELNTRGGLGDGIPPLIAATKTAPHGVAGGASGVPSGVTATASDASGGASDASSMVVGGQGALLSTPLSAMGRKVPAAATKGVEPAAPKELAAASADPSTLPADQPASSAPGSAAGARASARPASSALISAASASAPGKHPSLGHPQNEVSITSVLPQGSISAADSGRTSVPSSGGGDPGGSAASSSGGRSASDLFAHLDSAGSPLRANYDSGTRTLQVSLPESANGAVGVQAHLVGGQVSASIQVREPSLHALVRELPAMHQFLSTSQVEVKNISIDLGQSGSQLLRGDEREGGQQHAQAGGAASARALSSAAVASVSPMAGDGERLLSVEA